MSTAAQIRGAAAPVAVFGLAASAMMVVPAVRPLFAERGGSDGAMHAFMAASMLGAVLFAPALGALADAFGRVRLVAALAFVDALATVASSLSLPISLVLGLRLVQGAASVGALAAAMAMGTHGTGVSTAPVATALVAALVAGPPAGGLLLTHGVRAPFWAAGISVLAAAIVALFIVDRTAPASARGGRRAGVLAMLRASPPLRVAAALACAGRFTVGCFVVSFAVRAHAAGMSDIEISLGYSTMLVPFALVMYPVVRFGRRLRRTSCVAVGSAVYAIAFVAFGVARGPTLFALLALAGVGSALVYGPALCWAALAGGDSSRGASMGVLHAAGGLGMLFGPSVAGALSGGLAVAGVGLDARYVAIFSLAATAQVAALAWSRAGLRTMRASETGGAR